MHGRDLDPAFDHFGQDRVDLGLQQHEIAHCHRLAMHRLESNPSAERKRWPDCDAIKRHGEIGAQKSVAMHIAGDRGGRAAERRVDLLPINFLGMRYGSRRDEGATQQQDSYVSHYVLRFVWASGAGHPPPFIRRRAVVP
jgi:hypothetical protein